MSAEPGLIAALADIVGERGVLQDPQDTAPFLRDWKGTTLGTALAVVLPRSTAEVAAVVALCGENAIAIVAQGGNSGLAAGAVPAGSPRQVVLALGRMNRIRDLDVVDNVVVAEAGCVLETVQRAVAEAGRLLPISFGAEGTAQVGGIVATNAGGVNVLRYGNTRQRVLGIEVVLPDGTVLDLLGRLRKDNAGYDLKQLFIGSEGTLGIVTAVSLALAPRIAQTQSALVQLRDVAAALDLFTALDGEVGEFLSSFELISEGAWRATIEHLPDANWPFPEGWAVLVELGTGNAQIDLGAMLEAALGAALESGAAVDAVIAQSVAQGRAFWRVRESITEAERAIGPSIKHDVAVPLSRIADLIVAAEAGLAERFPGARPNIFGHVGDGNLHLNVVPTPAQAREPDLTERVNRYVHDLVARRGGSITAEHGVGQFRVGELARYKSAETLALMRTLKDALDPLGLMNPGKVLAAERAG